MGISDARQHDPRRSHRAPADHPSRDGTPGGEWVSWRDTFSRARRSATASPASLLGPRATSVTPPIPDPSGKPQLSAALHAAAAMVSSPGASASAGSSASRADGAPAKQPPAPKSLQLGELCAFRAAGAPEMHKARVREVIWGLEVAWREPRLPDPRASLRYPPGQTAARLWAKASATISARFAVPTSNQPSRPTFGRCVRKHVLTAGWGRQGWSNRATAGEQTQTSSRPEHHCSRPVSQRTW